eukprot:TRINITY_DN2079_c0_g1::TRINITY_DN2079_c0_g1_i2::g.21830::m.21830 TRINITY_DN2079_c0_g1::TRINITY_DN2079_c0_g1_i2::g.21830  ORF type:complete len:221 (-),score=38.68,sp/A1YER2/HTAI2_GORGO/37.10/9e-38,NAD_binding_10/PF13460.1/2e-16,Semialdhyde_dh/PF01118.19/6.8e-08,NmrA/PF05368.8/2e-07,NAD_binding_4/PF07993.7/0.0065,NAD_binding_4/PF07993.7/0.73,adh_short/PF00106.20/0.0012,adh_short/PF00106.20/81,Epimerase/PF01370.16/0.00012,Saccharop_dh/PF03435.13/0.00058,KR/PF08659.5/0.0057,KR/PF08659.5/6.2e+02,3Bet
MAAPAAGNHKALIIGGTGAIGQHVVRYVLDSPAFQKVTILQRRASNLSATSNGKEVVEIVAPLDEMEKHAEKLKDHDVAFCCLGTTRKDAGSPEAFRKVDLEYVERFAKLAKAGGTKTFSLVSSQGADANSWFLYPQTKGQAEEAIQNLGFTNVQILRPGLLDREDKARWVEKVASCVVGSIPVQTVAKAMVYKALNPVAEKAVEILTNTELQAAAKNNL